MLLCFYGCCNADCQETYVYWEDVKNKDEVFRNLKIDKKIIDLYLHQYYLSDDNTSETILDTLCSSTEGYKKMLYFHILNDVVKSADGALAEMLGVYCMKYINSNPNYALHYFEKHHDASRSYSFLIGAELYYNDICFSSYERQMLSIVSDESIKIYLRQFLNDVRNVKVKIEIEK